METTYPTQRLLRVFGVPGEPSHSLWFEFSAFQPVGRDSLLTRPQWIWLIHDTKPPGCWNPGQAKKIHYHHQKHDFLYYTCYHIHPLDRSLFNVIILLHINILSNKKNICFITLFLYRRNPLKWLGMAHIKAVITKIHYENTAVLGAYEDNNPLPT